jgi:hypothetical protein
MHQSLARTHTNAGWTAPATAIYRLSPPIDAAAFSAD